MNKKVFGISLIGGLFGYGILKGVQSIKKDLICKEQLKLSEIHSLAQQIEVELEMIKILYKDKITEDELSEIAKRAENLKCNWGIYEFQKSTFDATRRVEKSNLRWLSDVIYVQLEEFADYLDGLIKKYKG